MSALNSNNPNGGGKGEGPAFVSGTNAPTGAFDKSQVAPVEIPSYGGSGVDAPSPKNSGFKYGGK